MFLGVYPFLLGCPICKHITLSIFSYDYLYFCDINCKFASFLSNFFWALPPFFVLRNLAKGSVLSFKKKQLLVLLIFSVVCLVFLVSISIQIFIFFFLLTLDYVCFFLIPLNGKLGCLLEMFLAS